MTNKEIELQNRINHLEQVVSITNNRLKKEKYGLVWLDVPEDFEKAENKIQVLEEVKEKSISKVRSPDSFTKQNVFDFTHLTFSRWNLISKTSFAQPSCPKQGT